MFTETLPSNGHMHHITINIIIDGSDFGGGGGGSGSGGGSSSSSSRSSSNSNAVVALFFCEELIT
jgi:hypothetical protein